MVQGSEGGQPTQSNIQTESPRKGFLERAHGLIKGNVENAVAVKNTKARNLY